MKQKSVDSSRRRFLQTSSTAMGGLALGTFDWLNLTDAAGMPVPLTAAELPKGTSPKPVSLPHFPSRLHAFVWRNWPLVTPERMAQVVGAKARDIVRLGQTMGLGHPPRITREQRARSYITVIRRNWHVLPYDQLLELLGWSPEQLAYTLREDDVLFIKLGSLKPHCEPLRYQASDQETQQREREIARIVRTNFPPNTVATEEPLFEFVSQLSAKPIGSRMPRPVTSGQLRFCYSYFALFGDPLLEKAADPYPDGLLARLAQAGVNGVWLQTPLFKLSPFPWNPAQSAQYPVRLRNLRALVARARQHGIQVFLYLNEPRGQPLSFFDAYPQLKGVVEGDHAALCTSVPEVRKYLVDSVAFVCRAVPSLGGFFSITYSENLTNCWSHNGGAGCPRCRQRPPGEVVGELNPLLWQGICQAGTPARLIAWDWGWPNEWASDVIRQLPSEVPLMSVSEWSLPIERGGVKSDVGEYSISAIGPGPRAQRHWQWARERGLKTMAKIQAGNTWELSAVPYIPAVENVARHAANLRGANMDGLMLGWTLGGYPSPNLEVVAEAMAGASADEAMQRVAERRFGKPLASFVVAAWRGYSAAFREFPYHIGVLYTAPQQMGPANLLWSKPTGYHATMVGFPYDDLDGWRSIYPPEIFIGQFTQVAEQFEATLANLRASADRIHAATPDQRLALDQECGVAEAAAIHFRSTANQARFVLARRALATAKTAAETAQHRVIMEKTLQNEIQLARRLHAIQTRDARIGFEASNQYFYVPVDLMEKVLNCYDLLARIASGTDT